MLFHTLTTAPRPLFGLGRDLDRLFDGTFAGDISPRMPVQMDFMPATDIREDATGVTIELELAGVAPEQIEVTTDDGVLTIKGEKRAAARSAEANGDAPERAIMSERVRGTFHRTFTLPTSYDINAIAATFTNGVLMVRVPKLPVAQPKRIDVRAN